MSDEPSELEELVDWNPLGSEIVADDSFHHATPPTEISLVTVLVLGWSWLCVSALCFADVITTSPTRADNILATWQLSSSHAAIVSSSFYFGWFVGDVLFAAVANFIGRKRALYAATVMGVAAGWLGARAQSWVQLAIWRGISGVGLGGVDLVAYILSSELALTDCSRSRVGAVLQSTFAVGIALVGVVGGVCASWRWAYFWLTAPSTLLLFLLPLVPESFLWRAQVQSTGHGPQQGECAAMNQLCCGKDSFLTQTIQMSLVWALVGFVYYGITLSAGELSSFLCVNVVLLGLVEIPSYLLASVVLERLTRRNGVLLLTTLTAVCCVANFGVSAAGGVLALRLTMPLAMGSKAFCSSAFGAVWVWAPETYPSTSRTIGLAINSQAARAATIAAPLLFASWGGRGEGFAGGSPTLFLLALAGCVCVCVVGSMPGDLNVMNKEHASSHHYYSPPAHELPNLGWDDDNVESDFGSEREEVSDKF